MITIKNWSKYQSYKDRKPPWIRFHRSIIDDYKFQMMSADARALLPMLWLLACEHDDPSSGIIEYSHEEISFRLRQDARRVAKTISEIEVAEFITCNESVTKPYTNRNQTVTPETETETETDILSGKPDRVPFSLIIEKLNKATGKNFQHTSKPTQSLIRARWNEGFRVEDFETVINDKVDEWATDEKMNQYLRPQTLFGTKFESYLQSAKNGNGAKKSRWVK